MAFSDYGLASRGCSVWGFRPCDVAYSIVETDSNLFRFSFNDLHCWFVIFSCMHSLLPVPPTHTSILLSPILLRVQKASLATASPSCLATMMIRILHSTLSVSDSYVKIEPIVSTPNKARCAAVGVGPLLSFGKRIDELLGQNNQKM